MTFGSRFARTGPIRLRETWDSPFAIELPAKDFESGIKSAISPVSNARNKLSVFFEQQSTLFRITLITRKDGIDGQIRTAATGRNKVVPSHLTLLLLLPVHQSFTAIETEARLRFGQRTKMMKKCHRNKHIISGS